MIDTHAHIDTEAFDGDREQVIFRAKEAGVERIIIPAIEPKSFSNLIEVAESDDIFNFGIGIHPHNANDASEIALDQVKELAKHTKVVAIGEIGLDYYYDFAPKDLQKEIFREQIRIAKQNNLPIIVHNRESESDLLNIIESEQDGSLKGVLHCFYGTLEFLERTMELGFLVSFTGNVTFKKSNMQEIIQQVPESRFMLETDSPYMTPVPHRGKRNEPSLLSLTAQKIAEYRNISLGEVIKMTTINAKNLFKLASILLLFALFSQNLYSQVQMEPVEDDYEIEEEYNPFRKFIGIAPVVGFNTIVYTYGLPEGDKDVSNEGIIAYGGSLSIGLFDFLVIEGTYLYSKNEKFAKEWDYTLNPNYHRFYEISTHWIANPSGRINIYATVGLSFIHNRYGTSIFDTTTNGFRESTNPGINTGIGAYINIPTKWGLIVPTFGWRMNFEVGKSKVDYPIRRGQEIVFIPTESTSFFSIPRVEVIWFLPVSW